jgi:hypothetical protein
VIACLALAVVAVSHGKEHVGVLAAVWEAYSVWIGVGITSSLLLVYGYGLWTSGKTIPTLFKH